MRSGLRSPSSCRRSNGSYVGGAADLLGEVRAEEFEAYRSLFELVEKRAALLEVLGGSTYEHHSPYVRVGQDLDHPALREIALVGACYGLVHRALGAVSLIGPVRMDYEKALGTVGSCRVRALAVRRVRLRRTLTAHARIGPPAMPSRQRTQSASSQRVIVGLGADRVGRRRQGPGRPQELQRLEPTRVCRSNGASTGAKGVEAVRTTADRHHLPLSAGSERPAAKDVRPASCSA